MQREILKANFTIKRGNSGTLENTRGIGLLCENEDGSVFDLQDWSVSFHAYNGKKILSLTDEKGDVIVDTDAGSIVIPITVATGRLFRAGTNNRYEIEIKNGDQQFTIVEGLLEISEGITDD